MTCRPKQTPKIGISPAKRLTAAGQIPEASGLPGPGERKIARGESAAISSSVSASLRATATSGSKAPIS